MEPLTPERDDNVVPSWNTISRVGLLAGGGEVSAESSSNISDGRDFDISVMLPAPLWECWRRLQCVSVRAGNGMDMQVGVDTQSDLVL